MLTFLCNYGPFKKDREVKPVGKGRDFYRIKHRGTTYNVPACCVKVTL